MDEHIADAKAEIAVAVCDSEGYARVVTHWTATKPQDGHEEIAVELWSLKFLLEYIERLEGDAHYLARALIDSGCVEEEDTSIIDRVW